MRLKKHLEEAIVTPAPVAWKDIKDAIDDVYDYFYDHHKDMLSKDLHAYLNATIKKRSAWVNIDLKHNSKINQINGTTTAEFVKHGKTWDIEPMVTIEHNMAATFEAWRVSIGSTKKLTYKKWLNNFKATAYHEMVHAGQLWRWWNYGKAKTPKEFEKMFDKAGASFSKWLADKKELLITNYDKYHADGLEIMAFAQGAAIDLWKWGNDTKEKLSDPKNVLMKRKPEMNLMVTGNIKDYVLANLKTQAMHSWLSQVSRNFESYWKMKKKYPKVWKKFLKYLVQYLEHQGRF